MTGEAVSGEEDWGLTADPVQQLAASLLQGLDEGVIEAPWLGHCHRNPT